MVLKYFFFAEIFSVPGDDDAAHPAERPQQGAPQRVPGPQHRVQDAKQEGEGEFTEEIRQEVGPQRPRVLPGCGSGCHCISPSPRHHHHGSLLARSDITELLSTTSWPSIVRATFQRENLNNIFLIDGF